jgi:hypothetical protein
MYPSEKNIIKNKKEQVRPLSNVYCWPEIRSLRNPCKKNF